jgi:hypothetical protein
MSDQDTYKARDWSAHPPHRHDGYKSTILRSPSQSLIALPQTLSEITGPAFGQESVPAADADLVAQAGGEALGQRIIVTGHVVDEDGKPVPWSKSGRPMPVAVTFIQAIRRPFRLIQTSSAPVGLSPTTKAATGFAPFARGPIRGAIITMPGARPISIFPCSDRASLPAW